MNLNVFFGNVLAGKLSSTADRGVVYSYTQSYVDKKFPALSVSLPLRVEEFSQKECLPFFSGVLPEGDVKRRISDFLHVSESSTLKLLQELGGECAGMVSVLPEDTEPILKDAYEIGEENYKKVSEDTLAGYIKNIDVRPLLKANEDLRLSLAGAQEKLPLAFFDNQFFLPQNGAPSTHIIKPTGKGELSTLSANEYVCMTLAKNVGLDVPKVELRSTNGEIYLLVERYDRKSSGRSITRMHQEDMCQALGILSDRKYQNDGGPGVLDVYQLINRAASIPLLESRSFILNVLFNLIIGNCDAHGKNYSLLYEGNFVKLAPVYDTVCTLIYPSLTRKTSMKIGSHYEIDKIKASDLETLSLELDIKPSVMQKQYATLREKILNSFSILRKDSALNSYTELIDMIENCIQSRNVLT